MSECLTQASEAFTALIAAAHKAGLIPPEHQTEVLNEHAFMGIGYGTIFERLAEACLEALATTPEADLPELEPMRDVLVVHMQQLITVMSEERSYLTMERAGAVSTLLVEGQWQHVFLAMADKLVWVILNEEGDGSV